MGSKNGSLRSEKWIEALAPQSITQEALDALPEHSNALPANVPVGTMWKRNFCKLNPPLWVICELVLSKRGKITVDYRRPLIIKDKQS